MAVSTSFTWTTFNTSILNNGITGGNQTAIAAATSFDRSQYLAVWATPATTTDVDGRLIGVDATGFVTPVGNEFLVNSAATGTQAAPSAAGIANSDIVVAFTDLSADLGGDIMAHFISAGAPFGSDFIIDNGPSDDTQPSIAALADGGFVVSYTRDLGLGDLDIRAHMFNANGTERSAGLISVEISAGSQSGSSVAGLTGGGFVDVWTDAGSAVFFRRYDATGLALDASRVTIANVGSINTDIHVVGLADGGFAVAFTSNAINNTDTEVALRIYNADGTARTPALVVNSGFLSGDQNLPDIATLSNGMIVVSWRDVPSSSTFASVFNANGNAVSLAQPFSTSVIESEIAGLGGGILAEVQHSSTPEGTGQGESVSSTLRAFTRTFTSDIANDTLTGVNDGLFEIFVGNDGNDIIVGGTGLDVLHGGIGSDTASYATAATGVKAYLETPSLNTGDAAGDSYDSIENLTGSAFADGLVGDAGGNVIRGGGGADTMTGLGGNDFYYVDNANDVVIEVAGGGADRVLAHGSYTLGAGVSAEILSTDNTAGTAAINLTGNEIAQSLLGNGGANTLDGKAGADTMQGFGGSDTYRVDTAADIVLEAVGGGTDKVLTTVTYALRAGQEIEQLATANPADTTTINLTGNEFRQTITGNAFANGIDGKGGADTMIGLGGDDRYRVDIATDVVLEASGQGTDTVLASVSYILRTGQSIEVLATTSDTGTTGINFTGNELGQTIRGNAGANAIAAKGGNDILTGLGGRDTFLFDTALNAATNVDRITDFTHGADHIKLENAIFTALTTTGTLAASAFFAGAAAHDADDRIIYDPASGKLIYDSNGNLAGGATLFATLAAHLTLANTDFIVA